MIKAVYDTNVVVSALLSPQGIPARILRLAVEGQIRLILSKKVLDEYSEVLKRPELSLLKQDVNESLRDIRKNGKIVKAKSTVRVAGDPDDNIFLECALAGKAKYLVTGNKDDFPSERFKYTKIVSPKEFLDIYLS